MIARIYHVRKNAIVEVISGQHKGKTGKVTRVLASKNKVVVEKINRAKKHTKPTQKNPQGGVVEIDRPIASSNVLLVCPKCNKGIRIRREMAKGKKRRVCRKCAHVIDSK